MADVPLWSGAVLWGHRHEGEGGKEAAGWGTWGERYVASVN